MSFYNEYFSSNYQFIDHAVVRVRKLKYFQRRFLLAFQQRKIHHNRYKGSLEVLFSSSWNQALDSHIFACTARFCHYQDTLRSVSSLLMKLSHWGMLDYHSLPKNSYWELQVCNVFSSKIPGHPVSYIWLGSVSTAC